MVMFHANIVGTTLPEGWLFKSKLGKITSVTLLGLHCVDPKEDGALGLESRLL